MNPPSEGDSEAALLQRASYYTILKAISPEERAAWVEQAEAAIPLTSEQRRLLGLADMDIVLLPGAGGMCSPSQLEGAFPNVEALSGLLVKAVR